MRLSDLEAPLLRAIGGGLGIAIMATAAHASSAPLMTVPFATSIVMVMGIPDAPPARPRCVIGGHFLCAVAGVVASMVFGDGVLAMAVGVGLAMFLMHATDCFHPPAGINPVIIASGSVTSVFILSPVLSGALILVAFAYVFHRLSGERWPERWG